MCFQAIWHENELFRVCLRYCGNGHAVFALSDSESPCPYTLICHSANASTIPTVSETHKKERIFMPNRQGSGGVPTYTGVVRGGSRPPTGDGKILETPF